MKKIAIFALFRSSIRTLLLAGILCFLPCRFAFADNTAAAIEDTRVALEKWVEIQRVISQEKRDLALAKEMLNERIELVQREIQSLRERIREAEANIAETDKKRAELMEENDKIKETSTALGDRLVSLESGTRQLLQRLPDPIRDRVKPLSQRLPENPEETRISLAERYQNVVGILNEVDKFNREITITSEIQSLEDGSSVEVSALYLGIGQGFYAGAHGALAGIGFPGEAGWVWKANNEFAPQIAEAIAILKNERVASFVQVPVEIH